MGKNICKKCEIIGIASVFACAFVLAACGDNKQAGSEVTKDTAYENIVSEQVSEAEWRTALARESFANFSMKRLVKTNNFSIPEEIELGPIYANFAEDAAYFTGIGVRLDWSDDGPEFYEVEMLEILIDGEPYHYEKDVASDNWGDGYWMEMTTRETYQVAFDVYADRFSDFIYDTERGVYVAKNFIVEEYDWIMMIGTSWLPYVELKFVGGRLVGWAYRMESEREYENILYYNFTNVLYDYGKTEVPPLPDLNENKPESDLSYTLAPSTEDELNAVIFRLDTNVTQSGNVVYLALKEILVCVESYTGAETIALSRSSVADGYYSGRTEIPLKDDMVVYSENVQGKKLYWFKVELPETGWRVSTYRYIQMTASGGSVGLKEVVFVGMDGNEDSMQRYLVPVTIYSATPTGALTADEATIAASALIDKQILPSWLT